MQNDIQNIPDFFVHHHRHTGFSLYDGFNHPKVGAKRAAELGQTHLAITDHGTMSGNEEHYYWCLQNNIMPIQGVEAYFMREFMPGKEYKHLRRHMTLLAKNFTGYQNLCRLSTQSNLNNFYIKPIMDLPLLRQHNEGIIMLSGCVLGEVAQMIIQDKFDEACYMSEEFIKIFGDNFFYEVQPLDFPEQRKANEGLIKLSDKFGRPIVMTGDCHYSNEEDLDTYILFRTMGRNLKDDVSMSDEVEKIKKQYAPLFIASGKQMVDRWESVYQDGNGKKFAEQSKTIADTIELVKLEFEERVPEYKDYDNDGNELHPKVALAKKVKEGMKNLGIWKEPYIARAKRELRVITQRRDKCDYYLLTADIVQYAKSNDIPVGPGRGSGVASLCAYALGITEIDPIYFDLLFERFMHEERVTIPDFDVDFSSRKYHAVVDYVSQKYAGKSAQICNVLYYRGDNLVNDLAKALKMEDDDIKELKAIIEILGFKMKDSDEPEITNLLKNKALKHLEDKYGVISYYCKMYGNPKAYGQHASGIAITPNDIDDQIPLFVRGKDIDRRINTSYDMLSLTRQHIVKLDVLKLDSIDIVHACCKLLKIKTSEIPLDDQLVFNAYKKLKTRGIFQFDTPTGVQVLRKVQPDNIFELADATSLDRPGALSLDQVRVYVEGKAGKLDTKSKLFKYCHQTFGAFLYQEQIMMACIDVGMSWGEASKVMKVLDALPPDHPLTIRFVSLATKAWNITEKEAISLFNKLTSYTFNRGHAAAYAVLSYWGMWLKVKHPRVFFLETFRASWKKAKIKSLEAAYIVETKQPVFLAHVNGKANYSEFEAFPGEIAIRSGLLRIMNVGPVACKAIETENKLNGPFTSEEEFLVRMNVEGKRKVITSRVLQALQGSGALIFNNEEYVKRTEEYNSSLASIAKGFNKWH